MPGRLRFGPSGAETHAADRRAVRRIQAVIGLLLDGHISVKLEGEQAQKKYNRTKHENELIAQVEGLL